VERIDLNRSVVVSHVSVSEPAMFAVTSDLLWVGGESATGASSTVTGLDPSIASVRRTIVLRGRLQDVVALDSQLFASSYGGGPGGGTMSMIQDHSEAVAMVHPSAPISHLLLIHGRIWAIESLDSNVQVGLATVNTRPLAVRSPLATAALAGDVLLVDGQTVWVARENELSRYSFPGLSSMGAPIRVSGAGDSIVRMVSDGPNLWVLTGARLIRVKATSQ
jgi:hypothetical protein